ncbi:hypothetical protein ACTMTJ_20555 [Phytohabitans sp. LJ34]|uniref:hypothetical protein n=1 Tax=Phytohabitans sp. LJ34 TaxID=3452217 RepID=UPI003F8B1D2D
MRVTRLKTAACAALVAVTGVLVLPAEPAAAACTTGTAPLTVEEQRLESQPVPGQILASSGFDARVTAFAAALCATTGYTQATQVVTTHAGQLWEAAVDRAQAGSPGGQLAADDDRPLYWARLGMTRALRRWVPTYSLSAARRAALERTLERASRGITSSTFDGSAGRRLLVTGFDPFLLDDEIRRGNPSGAAALTLDGQVLTVNGVRIQVQTVVFPVRYADFDRGIVEEAIRPHVAAGGQRADAITTVSQGRGQFDLEVFNGRRRSVDSIGDNNNVQGGGSFNAPVVFPGVGSGPEFLRTSLPLAAMQSVGANPFPININPSVWEIPAGGTGPEFRPDGPTPGSIAVEGSGGGYLSNEVAYRNTLLLAGTTGAPVGGHVHTPTLGSPADPAAITDPAFEQQRSAIVGQVRAIVARAVM